MIMSGGILATTGLVCSHFVNSLSQILFTFGFITGMGLGLPVSAFIVIIYEHFGNRTTWQLGFASSGIGFGSMIFSPIAE